MLVLVILPILLLVLVHALLFILVHVHMVVLVLVPVLVPVRRDRFPVPSSHQPTVRLITSLRYRVASEEFVKPGLNVPG